MTTALRFDSVSLRYGKRTVVDDVTLEVEPGELLSLAGTSGCGKSSIIRLALGLATPAQGSVWLGERQVSGPGRIIVSPERRGLSVVFQDLALWPHISTEGHLNFVLAASRVPKADRPHRIGAMLERVGLAGHRRSYPANLSGGERQRLAIARALVVEPEIILLDEPLANLDVILKSEILEVFASLFGELGSAVIYVTHDMREAEYLGGTAAVMDHGRLLATGSLKQLRSSGNAIVSRIASGGFMNSASRHWLLGD
jgi:iron(III) transport system ATP-binding protein